MSETPELHRRRRAPDHRLGKFNRDRTTRQLVLDPLKRANRLAELGADLGVFDRLKQHRIGQPNQLRRAHQCTKVE